MAGERLTGTLAAAVTPLRDAGERLDEGAFGPLLEFYGAAGIEGVMMLGTTGEGILLTPAERRRVAELAVAAAGALKVIVHCGAQTTGETTRLAAHAVETGADAVAVIAPPYFAFTPEELARHFIAAASACAPLPFYLYEFADRSGYVIPRDTIERVRDAAPNVAGIKVSDAPFDRVQPYLTTGLDVFIGAEALIPQGLRHGAVGAVSGLAAAFPEVVAAVVRQPTPQNALRAERLRAALSAHPFPAAVKAALRHRGVAIELDVRAPLLPLGERAFQRLAAELAQLAPAAPVSQ